MKTKQSVEERANAKYGKPSEPKSKAKSLAEKRADSKASAMDKARSKGAGKPIAKPKKVSKAVQELTDSESMLKRLPALQGVVRDLVQALKNATSASQVIHDAYMHGLQVWYKVKTEAGARKKATAESLDKYNACLLPILARDTGMLRRTISVYFTRIRKRESLPKSVKKAHKQAANTTVKIIATGDGWHDSVVDGIASLVSLFPKTDRDDLVGAINEGLKKAKLDCMIKVA